MTKKAVLQKFPKTAEDLISKTTDARTPKESAEIEAKAIKMAEAEAIRHSVDPEYKAKARASYLGSVKLDKKWSPAHRLDTKPHPNDPNSYRWNHDSIRERVGMEDWEPVKDMDKAQTICPSAQLRTGADGRIYSGDTYLCCKPEKDVEVRNAQIYQKSLRQEKMAAEGNVGLENESFGEMHSRTKSGQDPVGVRFTGTLREDSVDTGG